MLFIAHLCSHFEDDLNYVSPFDKAHRRCSVCQDEFSTPFQTLLHKDQEHMMELHDFCCRICQQTYSSLVDLFTHLNETHVGLDMPYHCDRCSYRTSMHEDMAHHIRQVRAIVELSLSHPLLLFRCTKAHSISSVHIAFNQSCYRRSLTLTFSIQHQPFGMSFCISIELKIVIANSSSDASNRCSSIATAASFM